ncbi:unnamed protein product [Arabidopsis halleri]
MESGSGNGDSEVQRTMLELSINLMDSKRQTKSMYVLMATNRIDILDQALLRPRRIDRKIEFRNPNEEVMLVLLENDIRSCVNGGGDICAAREESTRDTGRL